MKKILASVLLAAGISLVFALDSNEEITVLQGLQEDENFSTLVSLLEQSGIDSELEQVGDFTLFAPTNDAFNDLGVEVLDTLSGDSSALADVLKLHVLPGRYALVDLNNAEEGSLQNLMDEPYRFEQSAGGLMVNNADLVSTDVENNYSNGVIHVVSNVILPASILATYDINNDGIINDADRTDTSLNQLSDLNNDGVIDMADVPDANNDGVIDELDYDILGMRDMNNDGVIDDNDLNFNNPGMSMGGNFTQLSDLNNDGVIDMADIPDTNNDGVIDQQDYDALGIIDVNNDGAIDNNDFVVTNPVGGNETSQGLVVDSDNDGEINCQDNDDFIDSDGDGTDADVCLADR